MQDKKITFSCFFEKNFINWFLRCSTERLKMKKLNLLLLLFLCGCMPSPTIPDKACSDARVVRVIRVTSDMILGWTDTSADKSLYSHTTFYQPSDRHYVYLRREPYQLYYPGQILRLPDSACIKYSGSYDYVVDGRYGARTLKGSFEPSGYPNPEYEALMKERYEKAKTSCWMRRRLGQKCNKK